MSIQSKILKDLSKYMFQMIVPALIALISVPIYTRLFDPGSYGNLSIVRVSINLLQRSSGWIGLSLVRYYYDYYNKTKIDVMLTTVLKTNFIFGILSVVLFIFILRFIAMMRELELLFQIGIILFAIMLINNSLQSILRIQRRINILSIFVVTFSLFSFLLSLGLIFFFNLKIESILLGNLIIALILLPILWKVSVNKHFLLKEKIDVNTIKKFASYGLPLTIATLGVWALDLSDRYIIKVLLNSYEVGVYSSCYNVTWNSIFLIVNMFYMMEQPLAMETYANKGKQALQEFINQETRLFFIFIIPIIFLFYAYSEHIFFIMVAQEYRRGIVIVPYVAVSVFIIGLIHKFQLGMLAMEKTKNIMYIVLVAGSSNVLLNIVFIPNLGILGAGLSTMLSYLLYLTLLIIVSKSVFSWHFPFVSLIRVSSAALISSCSFSLFDIKTHSLARIGLFSLLSIGIYVIALLFLKEISQNEISSIKRHIRSKIKKKGVYL